MDLQSVSQKLEKIETTNCNRGKILVTGGSGFFGQILLERLLDDGYDCCNIDLKETLLVHPRLESLKVDISDREALRHSLRGRKFSGMIHCAAVMAHVSNLTSLWRSNVDGTQNLARFARDNKIEKLVFISSNCLWGKAVGHDIAEDEPPCPTEIYGRSKERAEKILQDYCGAMNVVILRPPTIIDAGRLGLLAILFEFIQENRKVWVVGQGNNRYQFIFAPDLADVCVRALDFPRSDTFNVGSDAVKPLREVYQHVIDVAGSRSRVCSLPKGPTLLAMKLAHRLGISPLGRYHYNMIAEEFCFDTRHVKATLGWQPTLTNEQMLSRAYTYYQTNSIEIGSRRTSSAHRTSAAMGVIRFLKWIS